MKKSSSVVTEELLEFIYGGCFAQGSLQFHNFHLRLFMAWILVLSSHTSMNSLSDSRVDLGFYATRMVLSRAKLRISLWSFSTKLQFWVHLVELSVSLRVSMGSIEMVKSWQFSREPRAHFSSSFAIVTSADRLQSLRIEECCLVYWCSAEIKHFPVVASFLARRLLGECCIVVSKTLKCHPWPRYRRGAPLHATFSFQAWQWEKTALLDAMRASWSGQ